MILVRIFFLLSIVVYVNSIELKGLQILINLISGDFMDSRNRGGDEDEHSSLHFPDLTSDRVNNETFVDFVSNQDKKVCLRNDPESIKLVRANRIPAPIRVKCQPGRGNGTVNIVASVKEVVNILAVFGNSTKRNVEGSCALILFYTKSCPGSAMVAPHFNALAKQFPDIKVAAIDAFKFHSFNTDFGIVGLPTILLFHQGRPVVKFNDTAATVNNFFQFVTKHTGIKPLSSSVYVTSEDFNGPLSNKVEREPDKYLYLAWAFIVACAIYYFTKSKLYTQIVEMIKRNWNEAQHEHNS